MKRPALKAGGGCRSKPSRVVRPGDHEVNHGLTTWCKDRSPMMKNYYLLNTGATRAVRAVYTIEKDLLWPEHR